MENEDRRLNILCCNTLHRLTKLFSSAAHAYEVALVAGVDVTAVDAAAVGAAAAVDAATVCVVAAGDVTPVCSH